MWTPEEKQYRLNHLIEFLNNDIEAHKEERIFYTISTLDEDYMPSKINKIFEKVKREINYQKSKRKGGPIVEAFEYENPKGIFNYIRKAKLEELQDLEQKIEFHIDTMIFYNYDRSLQK